MQDVMQIEREKASVGGLTQVASFSIKASAKAFDILIDGLYSDKQRAIVREISTNAYDSHVMAGKADVPFQIKLPTRFDNSFSVRDFGVGLDHTQIMGNPETGESGLVTTLFASTKDQDNVTAGKFGLGFKVPFAYRAISSFGITSWKNGVKRVYSCYKDEGMPQVAFFGEEPSDEPQGVEITFPVQKEDIAAFVDAARLVAFGFDVRPLCNVDLFKDCEPKVIMSGSNWSMYRRDYRLGTNEPQVRQGTVLYPLDLRTLRAYLTNEEIEFMSSEGIVVDMPMGTVEITPSRESLSYNTTTVDNLVVAIKQITADLKAQFLAELNKQTTMFDALLASNRIVHEIENAAVKKILASSLSFKGKPISLGYIHFTFKELEALHRRGVNFYKIASGKRGRGNGALSYMNHNLTVDPLCMPVFAYYAKDKCPTYLKQRMEHLARINKHQVLLLRDFEPGTRAHAALIAALGRPSEALNFVDITQADFIKPEPYRGIADLKVWSTSYAEFTTNITAPAADDDNVYYVQTFRKDIRIPETNTTINSYSLKRAWRRAMELGVIPSDSTLVGIPASRTDIARKLPKGWMPFFPTLCANVVEMIDLDDVAAVRAVREISSDGDVGEFVRFMRNIRPQVEKGVDGVAKGILHELKLVLNPKAASTSAHFDLFNLLQEIQFWVKPGLFAEIEQKTMAMSLLEPTKTAYRAFLKEYPMLAYFIPRSNDRDVNKVVDYIRMVDLFPKEAEPELLADAA